QKEEPREDERVDEDRRPQPRKDDRVGGEREEVHGVERRGEENRRAEEGERAKRPALPRQDRAVQADPGQEEQDRDGSSVRREREEGPARQREREEPPVGGARRLPGPAEAAAGRPEPQRQPHPPHKPALPLPKP